MRRSHLAALAAAALAAVVAVPAAAAAGPSGAARPAAATKQVPGVLAGLALAHHDGDAPSSRRMTVAIGLARPNPAGEKAAYAAMYDPSSPAYHLFLTPDSFDRLFGVREATKTAVRDWLTADGLTVDSISADGSLVQASGTVAQLDRRFGVHVGRYTDKQVGAFLANDVAPTVPADLPITAVSGLDTVQRLRPATTTAATSLSRAAASFSDVLTPQNLWSIYDQPATDEGEGQTMGIFGVGAGEPTITQMRLFEHRFQLPKMPVQVVYTQPNVKPDASSLGTGGEEDGNVEWYLDAQASTGMAPKAKELQLWFSNTLFDNDIAVSLSKWVATPACTSSSPISTGTDPVCAPTQMNASFGECEAGAGNTATGPLSQVPYGSELGDELEPIAEPLLAKAAMMGRTLFASSGDTGSGCPEIVVPVLGAGNGLTDQPVPIVEYPCASQFVTCSGGTVLDTNGPAKADTNATSTHTKRVDEVGWMYGGGGPSHYIQQPTFQSKIASITPTTAPCPASYDGTPYADAATKPCRVVPDIAALSSSNAGLAYFIFIDGEPGAQGGTSLASPLSMGMWTRIQAASASASGNGYANEAYYSHYGTDDSAGTFFDVTCVQPDDQTGTCASTGVSSTNGAYMARKGYDDVTGLGVPDVAKLLTAIDGTQTARHPQPAQEGPQVIESTTTTTSPEGNAGNPAVANPALGLPAAGGVGASLTLLPALDVTSSTLTTSRDARTVTATITGPTLSLTPDAASGGKEAFIVYWYEAGKDDVYFLRATTTATGVTYDAGDTNGGYTTIAAAAVTGGLDGHTLTMSAPLAALGAPAVGSLLQDPAAVTQVILQTGSPVTNSLSLASDVAAAASTAGASRGQAVCVGGCQTSANGVVVPLPSSGGTSLAMTGLSVLVPVVALLLVGGGVGVAYVGRRRRET